MTTAPTCDHCQRAFTPKKKGQRFCLDTCRAAWHREKRFPGIVTGLRQIKGGRWSLTIRYPTQPAGIGIGTAVCLETADMARTDAHEEAQS